MAQVEEGLLIVVVHVPEGCYYHSIPPGSPLLHSKQLHQLFLPLNDKVHPCYIDYYERQAGAELGQTQV